MLEWKYDMDEMIKDSNQSEASNFLNLQTTDINYASTSYLRMSNTNLA